MRVYPLKGNNIGCLCKQVEVCLEIHFGTNLQIWGIFHLIIVNKYAWKIGVKLFITVNTERQYFVKIFVVSLVKKLFFLIIFCKRHNS